MPIRAKITHEDICDIIKSFAPKYNIRRAFYFGSYAKGEQKPDSDLDVLVETATPISLFAIAQLSLDLEDALRIPVDVIKLPLPKVTHLIIDKVVKCYGSS
jgi:predicted nucleotidyltransferase